MDSKHLKSLALAALLGMSAAAGASMIAMDAHADDQEKSGCDGKSGCKDKSACEGKGSCKGHDGEGH